MPTYLYLVTGPSGKRYVGITRVSISARWAQHVRNTRHSHWKSALSDAIAKYGPSAFEIKEIGCYATWEEGLRAEQLLIAEYQTFGPGGYNLTAGGEGRLDTSASDETRRKMSATRTGRRASPEAIENLRQAHRRRTPEQAAALAEKIRAANAARSDEEKARISEAIAASKRGKIRSAACVEKLRAAMTGRTHTPDAIERMRIAHLGQKHTEEAKARMSAIALSRREQTAASMREVWRKRREAKTS